VVRLVLGGLLGLFVGELYKRYRTEASNQVDLAGLFPLITLGSILVMTVVQVSFTLSLGLIAALTIVRFRGPVKSPEDLVYILWCVSIGLALGAGQPALALVSAAIVTLFIMLVRAVNRPPSEGRLLLTVAGDASDFFPRDGTPALDRLRETTRFTLTRCDQREARVEARGLVTLANAEEAPDLLGRLGTEFPHLRFSSCEIADFDGLTRSSAGTHRTPVVHHRSPGSFELIDSQPSSALSRREVKFALAQADSVKIRSILEVNCRRIAHRQPFSTVHTIYFDDARLSGCYENLNGIARRAKVRLRWYDQGDQEGDLYFEIKSRVGSLVQKERLPIRCTRPLQELTYGEIVSELQRVLPAKARELLLARPEAVLMSQYRREYFQAPGNPTRITLDEEIVCYSQRASSRPAKRFGVEDRELVILEVKIPAAGGGDPRELLHPLEPQITKSSKYVRACLRLGLLREASAAGHWGRTEQ
jgi:hypothetical protein